MPNPPDSHADLLEMTMVASLATIGPSGEPHCTPVWFDWNGDHIRVSLTTDRQKFKNIETNPKVAMSFVDPENPYRSMELRGSVTTIADDVELRLVDSLAQRYMGIDQYSFDQEGTRRVVVTLEPDHFTTWMA